MIDFVKRLFSSTPAPDFNQLIQEGAVVLDVRTAAEYSTGHIKGSVNIPVDQLSRQLHRLPAKQQVIITCCASGMRSASARGLLHSKGYEKVFNAGSWYTLQQKMK
jgi:rhodanese-related sulfurtransferase